MTVSPKCAIMMGHLRRHGEIGRHKGLKIPRRKKRTGSSPVAGTITDTVNDTIVSFTVSFFYPILPLNMVVFQTLQRIFRQRIFSSVAKMLCICPFSGSMNPYILCFQFVKIPPIRYITEVFVNLPGYSLYNRNYRKRADIFGKLSCLHTFGSRVNITPTLGR